MPVALNVVALGHWTVGLIVLGIVIDLEHYGLCGLIWVQDF